MLVGRAIDPTIVIELVGDRFTVRHFNVKPWPTSPLPSEVEILR